MTDKQGRTMETDLTSGRPIEARKRRGYRIYLFGNWAYALAWLTAVWLVFFVWNPHSFWRFVLACAFMVAWPKVKQLFISYERFSSQKDETRKELDSRGMHPAEPQDRGPQAT